MYYQRKNKNIRTALTIKNLYTNIYQTVKIRRSIDLT